ncbi:MAG: ester cyclase [Anaerolineales bacterium]|nr:ester cyclase [Anaerolineales bacterium]
MSIEQNKLTVRRLYDEVLNQENKAVIDEIFAANATIFDPFTGVTKGPESFRQLLNIFDTAFPGHRVTVQQVVAEGEFVSVLHTHHATHTGPFMGLPGTGKQVQVEGLELFRLENGRITEFWRKDDNVGLLIQLGIMPAPTMA